MAFNRSPPLVPGLILSSQLIEFDRRSKDQSTIGDLMSLEDLEEDLISSKHLPILNEVSMTGIVLLYNSTAIHNHVIETVTQGQAVNNFQSITSTVLEEIRYSAVCWNILVNTMYYFGIS